MILPKKKKKTSSILIAVNKWPSTVAPIHPGTMTKSQDEEGGGAGVGSIQLNECIPTEAFGCWDTAKREVAAAPTVNHDASRCSLPSLPLCRPCSLCYPCVRTAHVPGHATSLPWLLPLPVSFTRLSVSLPLKPSPPPHPPHFVFSHQPLSPPSLFSLFLPSTSWFSACWIRRARVTRHCDNVSLICPDLEKKKWVQRAARERREEKKDSGTCQGADDVMHF